MGNIFQTTDIYTQDPHHTNKWKRRSQCNVRICPAEKRKPDVVYNSDAINGFKRRNHALDEESGSDADELPNELRNPPVR